MAASEAAKSKNRESKFFRAQPVDFPHFAQEKGHVTLDTPTHVM
jgi:hypothetical protein